MRMFKTFNLILVLLALAVVPAHAGWVETSEEGVSYYGDGVLKQVPSPEAGGPESIMDFRKGTVTMVDHDSRTYTTFKFEEFCQVLVKMYEGMPPDMLAQIKQMNDRPKPNVTVKGIGKGEEIGGYSTTKYQVTNNGELERTVWMAEDARLAKYSKAFFEQARDGLKKMMVCPDLGLTGNAVDLSLPYLDLMKKGWLMKEEVVEQDYASGESAPVMELVEESLPSSAFEVPQGYRKVPLKEFDMGDQ